MDNKKLRKEKRKRLFEQSDELIRIKIKYNNIRKVLLQKAEEIRKLNCQIEKEITIINDKLVYLI